MGYGALRAAMQTDGPLSPERTGPSYASLELPGSRGQRRIVAHLGGRGIAPAAYLRRVSPIIPGFVTLCPQVMTRPSGISSCGELKSPHRILGVSDWRASPLKIPSNISNFCQPLELPGKAWAVRKSISAQGPPFPAE